MTIVLSSASAISICFLLKPKKPVPLSPNVEPSKTLFFVFVDLSYPEPYPDARTSTPLSTMSAILLLASDPRASFCDC